MASTPLWGMAAWAPRPVIVASKTMPAAVLAAAEETDDAGFGQSPVDLETPGGEFSGDGVGGSGLLEGGLRVLVDVAAPGFHIRGEGGDSIDDWHGFPPCRRGRTTQPARDD